MKTIVQLFLIALFFITTQHVKAAEYPTVTITTCLGSTSWQTWNGDYYQIKEICGGGPLNLEIGHSQGTSLYDTDEVYIYEIDGDGNEILVHYSLYPGLDFTPEEGKQYRLEINRNGSVAFEVAFESIDCLDFEVEVTQPGNADPDCFLEGQPIEFNLPFDVNNACYTNVVWRYGDGSPGECGMIGETKAHTFDFHITQFCKDFTITATAVSDCEDCPDYEFSKTITVCQFCSMEEEENHNNTGFDVAASPNPTPGPLVINPFYTGPDLLERLVVTRVWDGLVVLEEQLPADLIFPYHIDLTMQLPGFYSITMVSGIGEVGNTVVFKQ